MDNGDDAALAEMLGITSLNNLIEAVTSSIGLEENNCSSIDEQSLVPPLFRCVNGSERIHAYLRQVHAREIYQEVSVFQFPKIFSLSAQEIRRITLELIHNPAYSVPSEKTFETIGMQRHLTRIENFVNIHPKWKELCYGYLQKLVSSVMGEEYILYKEKLNLKPPGGSGFAPHVDTPSLRAAFVAAKREEDHDEEGPQTFITLMVAIDKMTKSNGCLRVVEGGWVLSEKDQRNDRLQQQQKEEAAVIVEVIPQVIDGNPDGDGRAGAIPQDVSSQLNFIDVECDGGDIVIFHGWTPHRSSKNTSAFSRRAVFLTYNPLREGDFHDEYYLRMAQLRHAYCTTTRKLQQSDYQMDLNALSSVPK
jgi:ectoine hydroxylase-related dioxygenase (phytanoyl-CoA dioxygenase family)